MSYPLTIYRQSDTTYCTTITLSLSLLICSFLFFSEPLFNTFSLFSLSFFSSASRYLDIFLTNSHLFYPPPNSPPFSTFHLDHTYYISPSVHPILCHPPTFPALLHHTVCFFHSLGIWMTVSCGAFCLCWPASASSSFSSRLSFFLFVSLYLPLRNLFHHPLLIMSFCNLTTCFPLSHNSFPFHPVIVRSLYFSFLFCLVAH